MILYYKFLYKIVKIESKYIKNYFKIKFRDIYNKIFIINK